MKFYQPYSRSVFLILMIMLLALTACERPFQEDAEGVQVPSLSQPAAGEDPFQTLNGTETPAAGEEGAVDGALATPTEATEEGASETGDTAAEDPADGEEEDTETAPALETNEAGQRVYVVASGDTVGQIAVLYGVTIEDIAAANPNLANVNVLDVGQELVIPEAGFAESGQAAAPVVEEGEPAVEATAAPAAGSTEEQTHIVRAGDTIYSIGLAYGFTVEELQEYNDLPNPDVLKIGDEIKIPPASAGE